MLGRIAIVAMGGCFSQNPDTGAAEATYFPVESVVLPGNLIYKDISREAGTTRFDLGYTETELWQKLQVLSWPREAYFAFVGVGTGQYVSAQKPRCWAYVSIYPTRGPGVIIQKEETTTTLVSSNIPAYYFVSEKTAGSNKCTCRASNNIHAEVDVTEVQEALQNRPFRFQFLSPLESSVRYWGDTMRNAPYGIHWRRIPMQRVEVEGVGLYDVDNKNFIEA